MKTHLAGIAVVLFAVCTLPGTGFAQNYPSKPVRLIVPSGSGSPPDIRARWLAEKLHAGLGWTVVVDNRPGASSTVGTVAAIQGRADGYTLLMSHQGIMALNPHLYPDLPYNPLKDLIPVSRVGASPMLLAVHPDVPAHSVADLIKLAREKPGQLNFGSPGVGTPPHMAAELFRRSAHIDVMHVPYKTAPAAQIDLIGGRLTYTFDGLVTQLAHVRAGTLRALAITSARRLAILPDVPTVAESGLPGYEYLAWMGICAPAGTPNDIIVLLNAEISKILRTPEARDWLASQGGETVIETPEEFAAFVRAEHARWGKLIREAGIKAD